jgi:ribosomal protein S27AE
MKYIEVTKKPRRCPVCGSEVYSILYGMPAMPEEEYFARYHKHVIYGGCIISECDPRWACSKCGQAFYEADFSFFRYYHGQKDSSTLKYEQQCWWSYEAEYYKEFKTIPHEKKYKAFYNFIAHLLLEHIGKPQKVDEYFNHAAFPAPSFPRPKKFVL